MVPDFASDAAHESRRRARVTDRVELLRRAWEKRWGQPSRGNPLFEGVPIMWHYADLAPDWKPSDDAWEAEIARAMELDKQGINPFTGERVSPPTAGE